MSGLTSIKEKAYEEDDTYERDCREATTINTQPNTQENDNNTNPTKPKENRRE